MMKVMTMSTIKLRTYSELSLLETFEERFDYLKLNGNIGVETFGFDRIFNQMFYNSVEWRSIRNYIIARDRGCDLAVEGFEINNGVKIFIHHMNPISIDDISKRTEILLNPEYLITTMSRTHNAIHYGRDGIIVPKVVNRCKNDTCPWKRT